MTILVLDTNFWYSAKDDYSSDAMSLLHELKNLNVVSIALDSENKIINEYKGSACFEFIRRWLYEVFANKPSFLVYYSSNLDQAKEQRLNQLGFEPADMPFVGLAFSSGKIIITEDSDYGKGGNAKAQSPEKQRIKKYLEYDLELRLYDFTEGFNLIRSLNRLTSTSA